MKYFVIGDEDAVLGFQMVGVAGRAARDANEAELAFDAALVDEEVAIVLITEKAANFIRKKVDAYIFAHSFPLICEIPGRGGRDRSKPPLRELANAAIGIKI